MMNEIDKTMADILQSIGGLQTQATDQARTTDKLILVVEALPDQFRKIQLECPLYKGFKTKMKQREDDTVTTILTSKPPDSFDTYKRFRMPDALRNKLVQQIIALIGVLTALASGACAIYFK